MTPIKVKFFQRKPIPNFHFSVEIIFNEVRKYLSNRITSEVWIGMYFSIGLFNRIHLVLDAMTNQGNVNHVTGDISFIGIAMQKRKTIQTILDCGFLNNVSGIKRMILKLFWLDLPVRRASYITTISEQVKNEIIQLTKCNEEKIHVIYIPVAEIFKPRFPKSQQRIPKLLLVGYAPNKNFERIINAIQGIECELHVVGKRSDLYERQLKKLNISYVYASGYDQIQMYEKYAEVDVLVFASTYEGFGMPIIEAQAVGLPVITSNCSSMPEVAGDGAHLVDPFNEEDIRKGILQVLSDENYRKGLVEKGFKNSKRFDPMVISKQYEDLYIKISKN